MRSLTRREVIDLVARTGSVAGTDLAGADLRGAKPGLAEAERARLDSGA